jgi:hypothetical protein
MSDRKHRNPASAIAILLLSLTLVGTSAMPSAAWARPGGSHHESNQGEVHKNTFWAKVVKLIKIHIVRPVTVVTDGGSSGSTCR